MNDAGHHITPRATLLSRLLWSVAVLGLVVVLGWQATCPVMEKYVRDRDDRAFPGKYCEFFNRELPSQKDLLTLTHTRVDLHPREPGALRVTVKLVNEATFGQPYPDLQITLTDRDGRVVGRRTFRPGHYRGAGQFNLLGSGELGVVQFDLARPHEKAVGFEIDIVAGPASS